MANSTTMYYSGKNPLSKVGIRAKTWWCRAAIASVACIRRCCVTTIRQLGADPHRAGRDGAEAPDRQPPRVLVPAPSIDEQREAKRLQRHTRPALTKHTDINRQRTPSNQPLRKPIRKAAVTATSRAIKENLGFSFTFAHHKLS